MATMGKRVGNMQEVIVMIPLIVLSDASYLGTPNLDTMLELRLREYINDHQKS